MLNIEDLSPVEREAVAYAVGQMSILALPGICDSQLAHDGYKLIETTLRQALGDAATLELLIGRFHGLVGTFEATLDEIPNAHAVHEAASATLN